MRVALVVPEYLPHPGGIQRHVQELASGLVRRGIEVEVLTAERDNELPTISTEGSVTVRRFRIPVATPRYTVSPGLLRYLMRSATNYDVVHAHNYHELIPVMAALARPSELILTPHYHAPTDTRLDRALRIPQRLLMERALGRVRQLICVTRAEADALTLEVPRVAGRITIIPNGVDTARITRAEPMHIEGPYVLALGRLEAYKRFDLTIRAAAGLPEGVQLIVAGDGPDRARLEELGRELGVSVRFLGRISDDDLHSWIRGAALVVTMSEREAFGLVILEAFAAGVGVVASDIPAHRETAAYGPQGAASLVPPGAEPETLAAAIGLMLATQRPAGMGDAVPTWDDMAARTLAVYEEMSARLDRS